ncbi:hypothetical protein F4818DRAFT_142181 [Hypoxylon cercidicola]|nr:hypothetical protein F4818DRAFT_142181 [Hypoxylon cercidicola]
MRCVSTRPMSRNETPRIRQTSCTDPKDKVYSLIGHATDVAPDQLSIDYNKSLTDVYVDVVRLHVFHKENPTIDILGHVLTLPDDITQQERANSPMPSWVPDWRQRAVKSPIHEDPVSSDVASYPYDPCPGTTIEAYIMDGTLELRGIVMENLRIETLTGSWYNDDASENLLTPRRWYDDFLSNGDASLDEPVRRALVGNRTTTVPGKQAVGRTQDDRMVDWDLVGMENAQLDRLGYRKKRMMIRDVTHVCFRRRMAMLTDRSIAIVPIGSQTGDQITLFHGGKALYVLRSIPERQDTFRFIGECYVEGLMDGALAELNTQSGRTAGLVRMI